MPTRTLTTHGFSQKYKKQCPRFAGRSPRQDPFLASKGRAQPVASSASFRFESSFRVANGAEGLELFSQREFEEGAEIAGARGVAELAQRLGFDLADALAGRRQHVPEIETLHTRESVAKKLSASA